MHIPPSLLLVSDHPEDIQTLTFVAQTHSLRLVRAHTSDAILHAATQENVSVVVWDADEDGRGPEQLQAFQKAKFSTRINFAVGDQ
jgi:hypothetical protein